MAQVWPQRRVEVEQANEHSSCVSRGFSVREVESMSAMRRQVPGGEFIEERLLVEQHRIHHHTARGHATRRQTLQLHDVAKNTGTNDHISSVLQVEKGTSTFYHVGRLDEASSTQQVRQRRTNVSPVYTDRHDSTRPMQVCKSPKSESACKI